MSDTDRLRAAAERLRDYPSEDPYETALADWLDETAERLTHHLAAWERGKVRHPDAWAELTVEENVEHHYGRALAVADAVLGEE